MKQVLKSLLMLSAVLAASPALAQNVGQPAGEAGKPNPLNNVYFGEQHLHTSASADAYIQGNHKNDIDSAFRYNKGEAVVSGLTGEKHQRKTPYDWTAVTDHAEYLGLLKGLESDNPPVSKDDPVVSGIASDDPAVRDKAFGLLVGYFTRNERYEPFENKEFLRSAWQRHKDVINKHNEPGKFTTLIAFEWTAMPNNQNLHRNVFFRDDEGPDMPFSSFDSDRPEDLWTYQDVQREAGHENLSIPHNGNLSNSLMYAPFTSEGAPIDARYAERRARNELLTEIIQTKSMSETHPALSPNDEFANFENGFKGLIGTLPNATGRTDYSFVRRALADGLGHQIDTGVNPFKYGIVGGADSHTGFSVNEENNYTGVHNIFDMTPEVRLNSGANSTGASSLVLGSAGATAVWAPENTREAIFDAMKRKEVYGTSGPLIRLRFFAGWDYPDDLIEDQEFVKKAYEGGVPMGGDLKPHPAKDLAKAPKFAVWALKDPESGNLDRIQIVKVWQQIGHSYEQVYDVVWSDDRKVGADGKVPAVGNTVDIKTATYDNSIGDSQLSAVWTDPDFDPTQHAAYYVRVLEIPTPRWSTYDAVALGIDPPSSVPATLQERAWSSPIWYTPSDEIMEMAASE
ncbi:MAG: DUF3604 domain-containing protein [Roseobacter sp.]|jgi:hypothetical protein